jgi:hypothetical protein
LEKVLSGEIIKYCIIVSTLIGVLFKVAQAFIYIKLMQETENVPASKNKLIKQMKLKFENCFKLNRGVNNVGAFVDKYMYKHRICGISLYDFNRIPIIAAWLSGLTGIVCGCICYLENFSVRMGSVYEIYGVGSIIILKLADVILDTNHKKKVVVVNLIDFFENSLINHLSPDVTNAVALTEEEREMLEEIPAVKEAKVTKEKNILEYTKNKKGKNKEAETIPNKEAEAIIQDVLSQFLS